MNNNWSGSLPSPRSSHQMVHDIGILYVIGGWNMQEGKGLIGTTMELFK